MNDDSGNDCTHGDNEYPQTLQKAHECLMNCKKFMLRDKKNNRNNINRGGLSFVQTHGNQNNNCNGR